MPIKTRKIENTFICSSLSANVMHQLRPMEHCGIDCKLHAMVRISLLRFSFTFLNCVSLIGSIAFFIGAGCQ